MVKMKKILPVWLGILSSVILSGSEMTFYASFDNGINADFAKGSKEITGKNIEFADGLRGKGIVIGGTPEKGQNFYTISSVKNFDIYKGAISFWIKPLDWAGTDLKIWNVFVNADGNANFLLYKFFNGDTMLFLYGTQQRWSRSQRHISDWERGKWHHIAATWDDGETALYIDGKLNQRTRNPMKYKFPSTRTLYLGPGWGGNVCQGKSVIDELKIYDTPISRTQVEKLFAEHAEASGIEGKSKLVLGSKTVKMTGKPVAENYAFSGSLFSGLNGEISSKQGQYFLSYDPSGIFFGWAAGTNCKSVELILKNKALYCLKIEDERFLLEKDGISIPVQDIRKKGNEIFIPFHLLGYAEAPEKEEWKMNVIFRYQDDLANSAAPVIGAIGCYDTARFYKMTFFRGAPHLRIDPVWDFANGMEQNYFSVQAGGNNKIDLWLSREHFGAEGWHMSKFPLWSNGMSTPRIVKKSKLTNSWSDVFTFRIMRNNQEELFRNDYYLNTLPANRVFYIYTKIKEKEFVAMLESGGKSGKVSIRFIDKTGKCVLEDVQTTPEKRFYEIVTKLDFDKVLKPGDYTVKIFFQENGKWIGDFEQDYRVPGPNDPTMRKFVSEYPGKIPSPWTPVKSTADTAEVWGRRYQVGQGFFPSNMTSGNTSLLNSPIRLELNGKTISSPASIRKMASSGEFAQWEICAADSGIQFRNNLKIFFDGVCESSLELVPQNSITIRKLDLVIPMKHSVAKLMTDCNALSWGTSGILPQHYRGSASKGYLWVGTEKAGISWGTLQKEEKFPLEITTTGEETLVRITLLAGKTISAPVTLDFGVAATPIKPQNNSLRRNRIKKETQMWIAPYKYYFYPDHREVDKNKIENAMKGYQEGYLYGTLSGMYCPYAPEVAYWDELWKGDRPYGVMSQNPYIRPIWYRNAVNYLPPGQQKDFINFLLNQLQKFYAECPVHPQVRNYYFDGLGSRHMVLEIHKMIKGKDPASKISFHTIPRNDMRDHFADITVFGEGFESKVARDNGYYNIFTPEMFRAQIIGDHNGTRPVVLNQIIRAMSFQAKEKLVAFDPGNSLWKKGFCHFYGYLMVHDTDVWPTGDENNELIFTKKLWETQDKLGWDENTRFFPYWEEQSPVKLVSPVSTRVMASAYTHSGKFLLAVLNDTDEEQTVRLALDLKKVGVKNGLCGADTWEPDLKYTLGDAFEDKIPARGFRLILFQ